MINIARRGFGLAALLAWGVAPTALSACHESRPTESASDNAVTPGALLPAAPRSVVDASTSRADAGAAVDAGPTDGAAPIAALLLSQPSEPRTPASAVPAASLKAAVTANNAFATALFGQVRAQGAGKNLLISPISASFSLTMSFVGSSGRTRAEMARALHFGSQPPEVLFEGQNALSQALSGRGAAALAADSQQRRRPDEVPIANSDYSLQIVNSIWAEASYQWQAPFLKTLAADYGTGVYAEDFRGHADAVRLEINAWVSAQTNDKIKDLLPSSAVNASTRLVLVNALHLKFQWQEPFALSGTKAQPFDLANKQRVSASFMHRVGTFSYLDDGAAQVIALPLVGRQLSVLIALPHAGVLLADYERSLSTRSAALAQPTKNALVALSVPKLTFTSDSVSLSAALKQLGMVEAFDAQHAHFDGMWTKSSDATSPYIGDVVQKTMIAMQETGVEAAAATAVVMETMLSERRESAPVPIPMIVDRPYLIAIVDVPTGAVLMLGHVNDPTDAGGG